MKCGFFRKIFPETKASGFTLIELLTVTAIIGILSATILLNYRNTSRDFALQRTSYKLAQDVRRVGEMAMSAKECCGGIVPAGGYGVWMEEGRSDYLIYADTNGNESYQPADDEIETIELLEKGVTIQDVNTPSGKVSINFKPPNPQIKINNVLNEVIITLVNDSSTKTVKVNAAGLAEVE